MTEEVMKSDKEKMYDKIEALHKEFVEKVIQEMEKYDKTLIEVEDIRNELDERYETIEDYIKDLYEDEEEEGEVSEDTEEEPEEELPKKRKR